MNVAQPAVALTKRISTLPWLIVLSGVWLFAILAVNPVGEFPLDDDWSYAHAVQNLVEHGRLELGGFTAMPLIAQVFWGTLFCLPFGFSFTALRVSTMALGLIGILATFQFLIELEVERRLALLAVAVLAFNPLYFVLSLTFMTDVPFFAFSMLALLFLLRALRTDSSMDLIIGYVWTFIAILIRQLAIVIPLSFLVGYSSQKRVGGKTWRDVIFPAIGFVVLVLAFPAILSRTIGMPVLYNRSFDPINETVPILSFQMPLVFVDRLLVQLVYLGLFTLPLLIAIGTNSELGRSLQAGTFAWPIFFVALLAVFLLQSRTMPLIGNVLYDLGVGPVLLRDTYVQQLTHSPTAPKEFWLSVTVIAILGSVLLIRRLTFVIAGTIKSFNSKSNRQPAIVFVFIAMIFYMVAIAIAGFLDRYLIWLVPLIMGVVLGSKNSVQVRTTLGPLSFSIAVIFALFSLGGTHDYLAWNRARWQALSDLMEQDHISYKNIDGGFEFNGWYAYDAAYRAEPSKSWWWVENDDYVISFGAMAGYVEIQRYPFDRWIPFERENIFVLLRVDRSLPEGLATQ